MYEIHRVSPSDGVTDNAPSISYNVSTYAPCLTLIDNDERSQRGGELANRSEKVVFARRWMWGWGNRWKAPQKRLILGGGWLQGSGSPESVDLVLVCTIHYVPAAPAGPKFSCDWCTVVCMKVLQYTVFRCRKKFLKLELNRTRLH